MANEVELLQLPDYSIEYRPAQIKIHNLEGLQKAVNAYANRYANVIVTDDTEKSAKDSRAKLNKFSNALDKKRRGARGVVIKTSEGGYGGTPYVNANGKAQIANARKAGLKVAVYHYGKFNSLRYGANDPVNEANLMANTARAWDCGSGTLMVLDAEDPVLRYGTHIDAAIFYNALKRKGFKHFDIYGPGSWFWAGRLKIGTHFKLGGWPAAYGSSGSGVSGAKAWQYTDSGKG